MATLAPLFSVDLLILAGNKDNYNMSDEYCKAAEKAVKCEDCEKRFHASCVNRPVELQKIESGNNSWYCSNCKAECSLCSGAVLISHKAAIRLSSVTNVKCGCAITVLLCQTQSMKRCKTQTVHGFAQNETFSISQTHFSMNSLTWKVKIGLTYLQKVMKPSPLKP